MKSHPSDAEGTTAARSMLLVEEVADELRVAPTTVRDWILARTIPHTRLPNSRRVVIPRDQLTRWCQGESDLEEKKIAGGGRVVRIRQSPRTRGRT